MLVWELESRKVWEMIGDKKESGKNWGVLISFFFEGVRVLYSGV